MTREKALTMVKDWNFINPDKAHFFVFLGEDYIQLSPDQYAILNALKVYENWEKAHKAILKEYEIRLDFYEEKTIELIEKIDKLFQRQSSNFVFYNIPILNLKKVAGYMRPFRIFYKPFLFYPMFIAVGIYLVTKYINYGDFALNTSIKWEYFFLLYFFTIIHEMGHLIASQNGPREINYKIYFGIYLLFPVLYTKMDKLWQAPRPVRIITGLAGIYSAFFMAALGLFLGNYIPVLYELRGVFLLVVFLNFMQFFPFMKSDGYWFFSDLLNIKNLQTRFNEMLGDRKKWHPRSRADWGIFVYGVFNILVILFFIFQLTVLNKTAYISLFLSIQRHIKSLDFPGLLSVIFNYKSVILMISLVYAIMGSIKVLQLVVNKTKSSLVKDYSKK